MLISTMKNKELNLLQRKVNYNQICSLLREVTFGGGDLYSQSHILVQDNIALLCKLGFNTSESPILLILFT